MEEAVKRKEKNQSTSSVVSLISWTYSRFFVLFKLSSAQSLMWLYWQTEPRWQQLSVWSDEVFLFFFVVVPSAGCCLWNLEWCCFQAPCFYPSYLLIDNFFPPLGWLSWQGAVLNRAVPGFFWALFSFFFFILLYIIIQWLFQWFCKHYWSSSFKGMPLLVDWF